MLVHDRAPPLTLREAWHSVAQILSLDMCASDVKELSHQSDHKSCIRMNDSLKGIKSKEQGPQN